MTPAQIFSACHLAGIACGIINGTLLPWWQSGTCAWVCAGVYLALFVNHCLRADDWLALRTATGRHVARLLLRAKWDRRHASAVTGMAWGCLAGALAADSAEILDAFLWPGHDAAPAVLAAIGVSLAWALAAVTDPDDVHRPQRRHNLIGLMLYLLTAFLAFGPAIIEVWT